MKLTNLGLVVAAAAASLLTAGCGFGTLDSVSDPKSSAPQLAGRWCLRGEETGFRGFFEMDEDGDPVRLEDNPDVRDQLGEDVLILDGRARATDAGLQYVAVASTTLDGEQIELFVEMRVASYGYPIGGLALKMEGQRVGADRLEGVAVTLEDFGGSGGDGDGDDDEPQVLIELGAATRPGCDTP